MGTWNLAGRWGDQHAAFVGTLRCNVLLLTEVSERIDLPGMQSHVTRGLMAPRRRWAGIWTTADDVVPLPDPHGATAATEVAGLRVCSSILPWRGCGSREPWVGANTAERTRHAVDAIAATRPTIWGGDWNHALTGREYAGSMGGRSHLLSTLDSLELRSATAEAPHQIDGLLSIDHLAVPVSWTASAVEHHSARSGDRRLSDHDAYVVEVEPVL